VHDVGKMKCLFIYTIMCKHCWSCREVDKSWRRRLGAPHEETKLEEGFNMVWDREKINKLWSRGF
jgi:hypothetical protein